MRAADVRTFADLGRYLRSQAEAMNEAERWVDAEEVVVDPADVPVEARADMALIRARAANAFEQAEMVAEVLRPLPDEMLRKYRVGPYADPEG